MIYQCTLLPDDTDDRCATRQCGLSRLDHPFGLTRIRNRNHHVPAFYHRCGDELLMRIAVRRTRYAKKGKFLLSGECHYSGRAKTEEFNSLRRQQKIASLLKRSLIELLPGPVLTGHAVIEDLIGDHFRRVARP